MSELSPLLPLYERHGLPAFGLGAELRRLYGGDLGLPDRCLVANFVSTVDGVVAIPSLERSNRLISDDSDADRFVMGLLRACADAVLVGSGTLVGSPTARWRPEGPFPPAASALAELRESLGLAERPAVAIVSASGSIDPGHPAVSDGALVLTTERGAAKLAGRLPQTAELAVLPGDETVDPVDTVSFLRERGYTRVLSEGGPTLFGSLVAAGLVDELFLTVSPLLAGRSGLDGRLGLVEGGELLPGVRLAGRLLSARLHGSHLFLRYGLEPPEGLTPS